MILVFPESEKKTTTASEDFKSNVKDGFRYVDKTGILIPLLNREHETTFFLRPRRFGKTLTLSMIRYFVEDTRDEKLNAENRELFQGLNILAAGEKYIQQMTSYPVINLTLQTVKDLKLKDAIEILEGVIQDEYNEKSYLLNSDALTDTDKSYFRRILDGYDPRGKKTSRADYKRSLKKLTEFLRKDSGRKAVVLIDEYDVPLESAYQNGYYRQMVNMVGPLLQNVLKSNSVNLQFAVVTGCLRIAKEGIYTGLNNLEVNTVLSDHLSEAIGFTDEEVKKLLMDSGFPERYQQVKDWYDGYRFGESTIYNPWSVIKHIEALSANAERKPQAHWANTSENAIIRELVEPVDSETREKMDRLMQGGEICFKFRDDIVYNELYDDPANVLNVMLSAGYLTATAFDGRNVTARIPNREVLQIFEDQISGWFNESIKSFDVKGLYAAMEKGNTERIEQILTDEFLSAMSYYESVEAFYHGVLLALMQLNTDFVCDSNRGSGKGRFDLVAKRRTGWDLAFVVEVKISKNSARMLPDAQRGSEQIWKKAYTKSLQREGYKRIMTYGIAFCEKRCRVIQGETL
ncbi:MAG: AAA family ATPase [Clostridia bacterium]|nr:AAA family ATPase [Clostridia bacterium]